MDKIFERYKIFPRFKRIELCCDTVKKNYDEKFSMLKKNIYTHYIVYMFFTYNYFYKANKMKSFS